MHFGKKPIIFELENGKYKLAKKIDQDGEYLFLHEGCEVSVDFGLVFG
jgi:hypothetical protein